MSSPSVPKRMTKQRRLVLEELRKLKNHPSAESLFGILRQKMPNISLGTVYRNLDVLVNGGLVLKLDLAGGQCRYDGDVSPHYHVRCRGCGAVDDIRECEVSGVSNPRVLHSDYVVTGWRMEFDGLCPRCQAALVERSSTRQEASHAAPAFPSMKCDIT